MIGFAVPVYVSNKIVAILSTECQKPKEGAIWPNGLIKQDCCQLHINSESEIRSENWQDSSDPTLERIDIWNESKRRIRECEEILGFKSNELLNSINEKARNNALNEVTPDSVEKIMLEHLKQASEYLSDLLNQNYKLEKESIIGWIRAEMASALSTVDGFWEKIRWCLENLIRLLGMDYILLISHERTTLPSLQLQCYCGLPEESVPAMQYDYVTNQLDDFIDKIKTSEHVQEIDLLRYREVPILSVLYGLYGKGINYPVLTVSSNKIDDGLIFMVLGKRNPTLRRRAIIEGGHNKNADPASNLKNWIRDDDQQHLVTIARELAIIVHVFYSIKKMQETKEEQTNLIESVAHDLKTPINNIMLAVDNLRNARMSPERASRTIAGVITQLERLNLFAQKAWMLEQIRQNELMYNDDEFVDVYKILSECRDMMSDLAADKSIEIRIDPDIEKWRSVRLDAEKFAIIAMNLIQNGIKYSFSETHIDINGWKDVINSGVVLTFANEGIQINDAEKDHIFERHYRSKEAVKTDPTGSGVGLVLVKEFVDHYKGRIDVRSTEIGFGRYLNVFSLYLPGR
jgi:signal transduction histidine kinase